MKRVLVGVGNAYRSDDGAGLAVAERVRALAPDGVEVALCEQEVSRIMEAFEGAAAAVVVDAVASGGEPGQLHRFDAVAAPVPARAFGSSTHAFGVGEAIELARALGKLPPAVVVIGIEGQEFAAGEGLSSAVEAAVQPAAEAVLRELAELSKGAPCTSVR
jgi:hydrogenase maturation protease